MSYLDEVKEREEELVRRLEACPEMDRDEEKWEKGLSGLKGDAYDFAVCIYKYAEDWSRLMQKEMQEGKKLSEIAEQTSWDAGKLFMTGHTYYCAAQVLVCCWRYGNELMQWHNSEYAYENSGA